VCACALTAHARTRRENKEDGETLIKAFEVLDLDGSGSIERDELRKVLKGFSDAGEHLSEDEIELLIKEADVDGDGQISFTEFAKVMMAEPEEGDDKK
jgi:calmodulin